jgi:hypothetical protein
MVLWIFGGMVALFLMWCIGSLVYLKLHYRFRKEKISPEPFTNLEKEQANIDAPDPAHAKRG